MRSNCFEKSVLSVLRNSEDEIAAEAEEDGAVTHVTKHDAKEEREGDDCEETRIGFLVLSYTISLNNFLSRCCEVVGGEVSRISISIGRHKLPHSMFGTFLELKKSSLQNLNITIPDINFPLHEIAIEFHFIQSYIDVFFLDDIQFQILMSSEVLAIGHGLCQSDKEIIELCLGEVEEIGGLVDAVEEIFIDLEELLLGCW